MKNMKKIVALAVALLVVLSVSLLAVACGSDEENGGTTETTANQNTTVTTQGGGSTDTTVGGTTTTTQGGGTTDTSKPTTGTSGNGGTDDSGNAGDDLKENEVKVTVRYENGRPVNGATVQICQGSQCFFMPIVTGTNGVGVGEYDLNGDALKAKVNSIKTNDGIDYLVPADEGYVYFEEDSRELVITIKLLTINVFDNNDQGVESATVQVYQGEHAFKTVIYTDADGIAYGYIAASGEELSAVVTEIDSGDGYVIGKTPVVFGEDETETTIYVEKQSAYTVKLAHLVGSAPLANIKVELYKKGSNMVQKTRYTDEYGIARFEDVKPGDYMVKVVFENPAYSISRDSEDGKYAFGKDSTELIFIVNEMPVITYTVVAPEAIKGEYISIYDGDHNYVTDALVGEDGVATFEAANGNYIAFYQSFDGNYYTPVIFEKNKTASGEMEMIAAEPGSSKETPKLAVGSAYIMGEGTVWVAIPFPGNKTLTVDNYLVEITIIWENGDKTKVEVGTKELGGFAVEGSNMLVFSVSCESGEMDVSMTVSAPGTYGAPFDVNELIGDDIDGKKVELNASLTDVYYKYTFKEDGTITITIPLTDIMIYIDGKFVDSYTDGDNTVISYPAKAGEEIIFSVVGNTNTDTNITFAVQEVKKTYTATVYLDFVEAEGVVAILYKLTDEGLVEIARATTDARGVANFGELLYLGDYAVKVVAPENYVEQDMEIYFEYVSNTVVYINHVKDGSTEYPFEVETSGSEENVTIDKGQTLWYNINIMPSHNATIVFNSENVQFVIYYEDTNGDGIVGEGDTPYGTSQIVDGKATFAFADNERQYVIKVTSIDGEAVDTTYQYINVEPEAGSDVENAKDVEGGFGDAVGVTAGQVVYYRYFGDACKLTVTVAGEDVVLVRIIRSLDGDTEEVIDGNCLVIDDTEYDMIYFAVKANSDTTFELSVTAE